MEKKVVKSRNNLNLTSKSVELIDLMMNIIVTFVSIYPLNSYNL